MELIVYNNLKDKGKVFKFNLTESIDTFNEELEEWCHENLEENGFYELDPIDEERTMIDIPDDEPDWVSNQKQVILKVGDYLNSKMINYRISDISNLILF